jgi:hypothetical protein
MVVDVSLCVCVVHLCLIFVCFFLFTKISSPVIPKLQTSDFVENNLFERASGASHFIGLKRIREKNKRKGK